MKRILTFVPNYFPGYMSGGIARTILNTADWLGDEFEFLVATRDRDLGSDEPYPDVKLGAWNRLGKSSVRYLAPEELSLKRLAGFVNATPFDVLHLNSFFDPVFTIRLLLLLRLKRIQARAVLLSPRGEFVAGPLALKYAKKKLYMVLSSALGFYGSVRWHASAAHEAEGIAAAMQVPRPSIRLAIDLPVRQAPETRLPWSPGERLRVIFLSRITREKNLDGALRILQGVRAPVSFDIVGPQEDPAYWRECEALIAAVPPNVAVSYRGAITPEQVFGTLSNYDLFLFPSRGENYAHVIAESISVGTMVLVSQFTPWRNLEEDGVGWDVDLSDTGRFVEVIEHLALQAPSDRMKLRDRARASAIVRLSDPDALEQNRSLFSSA
jgi:glycosyltransferase involved in cell wall biosynthesis